MDQAIRVEVTPDGVFVGFFAEDGQVALLDINKLSRGEAVSPLSASALAAWAADQRKQERIKHGTQRQMLPVTAPDDSTQTATRH